MDAVEYLSTRRRLCEETHCGDCPLSIKHNGQKTSCRISVVCPEEEECITCKWEYWNTEIGEHD